MVTCRGGLQTRSVHQILRKEATIRNDLYDPQARRIVRRRHAHCVRRTIVGGIPPYILCAANIFTGGFVLEIPLGRNIRQLRLERGMTQRQLAWHLRVSTQAVSKWERGHAYPDLSLLIPLARLFDVSLDRLFGREDVG